MTEKEALQQAADEARKAARASREFGGLLDDYAKYLTQPNWRQRADDSYRLALNKLNVINEGLVACLKLTKTAEAVAADSLKQDELKQTALQQESEREAIAQQEIAEKPKSRSIRVEKKAVGN